MTTLIDESKKQFLALQEARGLEVAEADLTSLLEIPATMQEMAQGGVDASLRLHSGRVGIGKSSMLEVATPLVANTYPNQGILICLNNVKACVELARRLHESLGLDEDGRERVCIYGSDSAYMDDKGAYDKYLRQGTLVKDFIPSLVDNHLKYRNAQVMITTQQMLMTRGRRMLEFGESLDFTWKFEFPRRVVVWDEKLDMSMPSSLQMKVVRSLDWSMDLLSKAITSGDAIRGQLNMSTVAGALEDLVTRLTDTTTSSRYVELPDWTTIMADAWASFDAPYDPVAANTMLNEAIRQIDGRAYRNAIHDLLRYTGGYVLRESETVTGNVQVLPSDFGPAGVLVLDGSSNFRPHYDHIEREVKRLEATKPSYAGVDVHWMVRPAGKEAWHKRRSEYLGEIKQLLTPQFKWLVLHRKSESSHVLAQVGKILKENECEHQMLYYGSPRAIGSNEFRHFTGVLVLSPQHLKATDHKLIYSGLTSSNVKDVEVPAGFCASSEWDLVYQGIGRCALRTGQTNVRVVMFGSEATNLSELMATEFPDCSVTTHRVAKRPQRSRAEARKRVEKQDHIQQQRIGQLIELIDGEGGGVLSRGEAATGLGMHRNTLDGFLKNCIESLEAAGVTFVHGGMRRG